MVQHVTPIDKAISNSCLIIQTVTFFPRILYNHRLLLHATSFSQSCQMSLVDHFTMRDASLVKDKAFIVSVFDSSLPYMASFGSQAQWGSMPFSQRPGWIDETQRQIQESEQNSISNTADALRILALEVEVTKQGVHDIDCKDMQSRTGDDGRCLVAVGFAFVRGNWLPNYLHTYVIAKIDLAHLDETLYVEVMVSDSRMRDWIRGIGAALLCEVRKRGYSRGKKTLYLDGWAGNERKLIEQIPFSICGYDAVLTRILYCRYYERQDFHVVANFSLPRASKDPWVGTLMSPEM